MALDRPIVTNIAAAVSPRDGTGVSLVAVESTAPVRYRLEDGGSRSPLLRLVSVLTRMPEGTIGVHDGLIAAIRIGRDRDDLLLVLDLEHAAPAAVRQVPGLPARLRLELGRAPLLRIMRGRAVLIDPGHGGGDAGGRGPIDLLEKNMTLAVAKPLFDLLAGHGCLPLLTRPDDANPSWEERMGPARLGRCEAVISLHTGWYPDPARRGMAVYWLNDAGRPLAEKIHAALLAKLPLPHRALAPGERSADPAMPAVTVEFATISNPVEEGWLRSGTFIRRAAGAVFNGLKDYFATIGPAIRDAKNSVTSPPTPLPKGKGSPWA